MSKVVVVTDPPQAPKSTPRFNFLDLFKWIGLLEEVVTIWNAVHTLPVGGDMPVPDIKVQVGHEHYTWHPGTIHRDI